MTVEALQTALAAEHAAVYVYGFLGARTSESGQPLVFAEVADAYATHRAWRDLLIRRLLDEGAEPVPAAPTYELPTVLAVTRAAAELEARCADTYAYVVANTAGDDRRWGIEALTGAAIRQVAFGRPPGPFPGAADLS